MATPIKLKSGGGLDGLSTAGKSTVGLVMTVLAVAAYLVFFYDDVTTQIEQKQQELSQQRTRLAEAEAAKREYNKDLARRARHETLARKQKKMLPDDAEMPTFLSTLQTVATVSGVTLSSWKPLDETPEQFYAKLPMELKVQGKYHQIAKFFYGIGQVDRIINMENIEVLAVQGAAAAAGAGTQSEAVAVTVNCLATAFRALTAAAGAKTDSPEGAHK
ncbi:MAG: hypothetical protein EXR75_10055 [Myxococcales bacterium]|nr:hypothetical protein [Myxococcales bacterium]